MAGHSHGEPKTDSPKSETLIEVVAPAWTPSRGRRIMLLGSG